MIVKTEDDLIQLGERLGRALQAPALVELVGDVGAGKTTLTKGLAKGLGVDDEVTSPSFTISKRYQGRGVELVHYDFYRLEDPGLMSEDLEEALSDPHTITVLEWGSSVENILPKNHPKITIKTLDDGTREVILEHLK